MSALARLAELGITLPPVSAPVGSYVPAVRTGSLVYTSGQVPKDAATGKVGDEARSFRCRSISAAKTSGAIKRDTSSAIMS